MRNIRCLVITITSVSGAPLLIRNHWLLVLVTCTLFVASSAILFLLVLPGVWSRKKFRRDASRDLIKLIIESLSGRQS
jgi:uncharacterized membrane protein